MHCTCTPTHISFNSRFANTLCARIRDACSSVRLSPTFCTLYERRRNGIKALSRERSSAVDLVRQQSLRSSRRVRTETLVLRNPQRPGVPAYACESEIRSRVIRTTRPRRRGAVGRADRRSRPRRAFVRAKNSRVTRPTRRARIYHERVRI